MRGLALLLMVFAVPNAVDTSVVAPSTIAVFSKFANLQGIYEETKTYKKFPVFAKNGMTLWHEANAINTRHSKWIFSHSVGSNNFFWGIDSSASRPDQINQKHLGESIDRIVRLVDLVPRDLGAPVAVIVESGYSNLDGVYRRQPEVHMYFPVYYNADSALYLWHHLFRNEWVCSDVLGGNRYMWRVPSSDPRAMSPSTSDVHKITGDHKITAIHDVDSHSTRPVDPSRMPKGVVVFSKYTNRRGIYERSPTAYEGFPVYTDDEAGLSLWHDLGNRWVCSDSVGSGAHRAWRVKSGARSPDLIPQKNVDTVSSIDRIVALSDVVPTHLNKAPVAVTVKSPYTNVAGLYEHQKDPYLHFPVYYSEKTTFFLWHDLWEHRWVSSSKLGEGKVAWWIPSATRALSPATADVSQIQGNVQISALSDELWTWQGNIDPKYLHKDLLFTDNIHLPPTCDSIGKCGDPDVETEWIRAMDLNRDHDDHLWIDITPNDITQGSVGNCWLIAAFSGLAQFPHLIENVFETKVLSHEGQYKLRFWDVRTGEWVVMIIDDLIPCKRRSKFQRNAEPLFARARHNGELWPLLLEKGFASFVGSYALLTTGQTAFAWQALTGCSLISFTRTSADSSGWTVAFNDVDHQRARMVTQTNSRQRMGFLSVGEMQLSSARMFTTMERLYLKGQVMSAVINEETTDKTKEQLTGAGLESNHAFTVLEVVTSRSRRLVRLRNPWGNDKTWRGGNGYPEVKSANDDGGFWMSWPDFSTWFTTVDASSNIPVPNKGTALVDAIESLPDAIAVFSQFINRYGVYERRNSFAFPAFEAVGTSIGETSRFLWYEFNSAIWVCSAAAGSFSGISWAFWSEQIDPTRLRLADLDAIDRIVRLSEVTPKNIDAAPTAVIVESGYSNLDGVYRRQPEVHMYFPVYYNANSVLYLWHDLFQNEWVCSEVIGGKRYMWRVPSSNPRAISPSTSDMRKITGDRKITAIRDVDSHSTRLADPSRMPKAVVVFSKYSNRRGIYERSPTAYEGFPVYTDDEGGLSLWHDLGNRWVCSDSVGNDVKMAWRVKSGARSPDLIPQTNVDTVSSIDRIVALFDVVPAGLNKAPVAVIVKSPYTNVAGLYEHQKDPYLHFPVYYSEKTTFFLWHDLWEHRWVSSSKLGEGKVAWWIPSATRALSPATADVSQIQGNVQISALSDELWTWQGNIDPKYLHKDLLFTDNIHLPPTCDSIGIGPDVETEWIRAMDLNRDHDDHLWIDITPNDITQGPVGNGWLIAAFSGLAQFPHLIENVFETKVLSRKGQYKLRFWDVRTGEWVVMIIDDLIPCKRRSKFQRNAEPLFARARHNGELWPLLLEKGFASFVGSYTLLTTGQPAFAWQALTGCSLISFIRTSADSSGWTVAFNDVDHQRARMVTQKNSRPRMGFLSVGEMQLSSAQLFTTMKRLTLGGQVMSAVINKDITSKTEEELTGAGLESNHAFTVLEVVTLRSRRLVRLRNPWGNDRTGRGVGRNNSSEPNRYPGVEGLIGGPRSANDEGVFWMSWPDFSMWFTSVDASSNIPAPNKGTALVDAIESLPDAIAVFSQFTNRYGVYERRNSFAFPAFEAVGTSVRETSRFLWYDFNSAIWVCSAAAGSFTGISWAFWSEQIDPTRLRLADLDAIDRIVRLSEVIPKNIDAAPTGVIVESGYSNLDGVYQRQPEVHMYFPVYYNAKSVLYLWHDLFRNEWVCSEVIGGIRYIWRVPSSNPRAISPSTSDVHEITGDRKITAIHDVDSHSTRSLDFSRMPKAVVVFSKYTNRRGIYERSPTAYEGFPVYTDDEAGLSLWHDLGNRWVCSDSVGSEVKMAWRAKSGARSPNLIPQKNVDTVSSIDRIVSLSSVTPTHLSKAPAAVKIESIYTNVAGVYNRQKDPYLYFPVYYSEKTTFFLWHDLWTQCWVSSEQIGGSSYMWRVRSGAKSLSPTSRDLLMYGIEGTATISDLIVLKSAKRKFSPQSKAELREAVASCLHQSPTGDCCSCPHESTEE